MLVPVGVLAVLATVGGWLQFPPLWDPSRSGSRPSRRRSRTPSRLEHAGDVTSVVTVLVGLAGIAIAWAIYAE